MKSIPIRNGLIRRHILVFPPASPPCCCQTNGKDEGATSTTVEAPNTWTHPRSNCPRACTVLTQRQPAHTIWLQLLPTEGPLPTMGQGNKSLLPWPQGLHWGEHTIERPWGWQVSPRWSGFASSWGIGLERDLTCFTYLLPGPSETPKVTNPGPSWRQAPLY